VGGSISGSTIGLTKLATIDSNTILESQLNLTHSSKTAYVERFVLRIL